MPRGLALVTALVLAGATAPHDDAPARGHFSAPLPYDGRFTLVRLRWGADLPASRSRSAFPAAWIRDYPQAEQNLSSILRELTYLDVHDEGNEILTLDDPELFKYPIACMWEPGFWNLTDREAASFRAYLQKGGFAIFEELDGTSEWAHLEAQMRRVLPDGSFVRLDRSHPIFDAFFAVPRLRPTYYGIFEGNDQSKRLLTIANVARDVPEYEAHELGVNYLMYGLTH